MKDPDTDGTVRISEVRLYIMYETDWGIIWYVDSEYHILYCMW